MKKDNLEKRKRMSKGKCTICGKFGFAIVKDNKEIDRLCGVHIRALYFKPKEGEQQILII